MSIPDQPLNAYTLNESRNCRNCGKPFLAARPNAFYCSLSCRDAMQRTRLRGTRNSTAIAAAPAPPLPSVVAQSLTQMRAWVSLAQTGGMLHPVTFTNVPAPFHAEVESAGVTWMPDPTNSNNWILFNP